MRMRKLVLSTYIPSATAKARLPLFLRIAIAGSFLWSLHDAASVKVFILAGQSNMVGMGSIDHLDSLVDRCHEHHPHDGEVANEYRKALCGNGTYRLRDDVFIKFNTNHGNLTVERNGSFAGKGSFGPELMIGNELGNHLSMNSVLLIKTAWGGKDLAVDFRPPASGEGNFSRVRPTQYGVYYRAMIMDVLDTLSHVDAYVPSSQKGQDYELSGFFWFQGWNDMLLWDFVNEYETNLANLIRDVRKDLDVPSLPVVIGELGMHGPHPEGKGADRVLAMRAAERNVTTLPEFQDNTLFVSTNQYVVSNGTQYAGGYHYYGRADTYFNIGRALGKGMLKMMGLVDKPSIHIQNDAADLPSFAQSPSKSNLRRIGESAGSFLIELRKYSYSS